MPTIPRYESQVGIRPSGGARIPTNLGAAPFEELKQIGGKTAEIGIRIDEKLGQLRQVQELGESQIGATKALYDLHNEIINSQDFNVNPESATKSFEAGAQKIQQDYLGKITDPEVKTRWQDHFNRTLLSQSVELQNAARKKRINMAQGSGEAVFQQWEDLAAQAGNPEEFSRAVNSIRQYGNGLIASGAWEADFGVKRINKSLSNVSSTVINRDIRNNPEGALKALLEGDYSKYLYLEEDMREKLTEKAQREVDRRERHADVEATRADARNERERKRRMDETEMDLWGELDRNELTIQKLDEKKDRREVDSSGYNALRRALRNEEGANSPEVVFDIEDQLTRGDLTPQGGDELRGYIRKSVGYGLSHKTAGEFLRRTREAERQDDISKNPDYKLAVDYVDEQLRTKGPLESVEPTEQARRAKAKREFDERMRAGEKPWDIADDIVPRYRKEGVSLGMFPRPRFLEGPMNDTASLDAAEQRTVEEFKTGKINARTFERETQNIKEIRLLILRDQEAAAALEAAKKQRGKNGRPNP